jgi:hypothetical protein
MDAQSSLPPTEAITVTGQPPAAAKSHFWSGSSFGFTDILAAINPLQHLPIIAPIYRAITGDTIGNVARVAGDALYGGPIGLASGLLEVAVVEITGEDIGQHLVDLFEGGKTPAPAAPAAAPSSAPAPGPAYLSALPQGTTAASGAAYLSAMPHAPSATPDMPQFGNGATASKLAAAAPITPLDVSRMVAQTQASATPASASAATPPQPGFGQKSGIAIDVSADGIAKMRAVSASHSPAPVALNLPQGSFAPGQPTPAITAPPDFAQRMKEGLAKYDALMAAKSRDDDGNRVDQIH